MNRVKFLSLILLLALAACPSQSVSGPGYVDAQPLQLDIASVNDLHSRFEATQYKLSVDLDPVLRAKAVYVELGGYPRLAKAVKGFRGSARDTLFLVAGDIFQGTLYFTKFEGTADAKIWALMGPDALTLGNHEFDKGSALLAANFLADVSYPVLSANLDYSAEPAFTKGSIAPYAVKILGGTRVGIVGITTEETPFISSPGDKLKFLAAAKAAQESIDTLTTMGVNKIILLSHIGYFEDQKLAAILSGVDLIVGGHSHSLLGDFTSVGAASAGSYPTLAKDKVGEDVLVIQSWEWGKVLGRLSVSFDAAGKVVAYKGDPALLAGRDWFRIYDLPDKAGELKRVQFTFDAARALAVKVYDGTDYKITLVDDPAVDDDQYDLFKAMLMKTIAVLDANPRILFADPDPEAAALAASFATEVTALKGKVVCTAAEPLTRGFDKGPGPLIADAMRAKTGAKIAITNSGGIRIDIPEGPISVATVYELIPFGNTLVTMNITGADLKKALEQALGYALERYGATPATNPFFYVSGIKLSLDLKAVAGSRIAGIKVLQDDGGYADIDSSRAYSLVVNNFMAAGGDRYDILKTLPGKVDTGFVDAEALLEFLTGKSLTNPESRMSLAK